MVSKRLTSALEVTSERPPSESTYEGDDAIKTTEEEIEAFHIIKSVIRVAAKADRVVMRDSKSYCAILLDDNNRKPIARLHFNRTKKYMSLFSGKQEERVAIEALEDIYEYADRLHGTVRQYGA